MTETTARRYCTRSATGECGYGETHPFCDRNHGNECVFEYNEDNYHPSKRYAGTQWPPPRRWVAADGTIVYRSYADYVD